MLVCLFKLHFTCSSFISWRETRQNSKLLAAADTG